MTSAVPPHSVAELAAECDFSGVVRVDRDGEVVFEAAYGLADRRHGVANGVDTRFGLASGAKGFTALAVLALVADGRLSLDATARSVLGDDLPLIDDGVTIEHLLAHRSGIGDYFDEESDSDIDDYLLAVPVHQLDSAEAYLRILDGYPQKFAPGSAFAYNNGGFVVLAVIAERVAGRPYGDLVADRVCRPAGMVDTAFLRSDSLPGRTALGYLADGVRTNVLHLPVMGVGDGGIYSTAADVARFWPALLGGRIVPDAIVAELLRPRSEVPDEKMRYGLGFWIHEIDGPVEQVELHGYDAGVSFRSVHRRTSGITTSVLANTSAGAWPLATHLDTLYD